MAGRGERRVGPGWLEFEEIRERHPDPGPNSIPSDPTEPEPLEDGSGGTVELNGGAGDAEEFHSMPLSREHQTASRGGSPVSLSWL